MRDLLVFSDGPYTGEIILPPQRTASMICDCCRQLKPLSDGDCCGICEECLISDPFCDEIDLTL
ncbi:hypothetical protein C8J34_13113 [Rhizobium sp. PP-F2F-G36]|nr:hypothetical protein C8J34_13113 [Rhizobium sp. PP-F2F-G36]